MEKFLKNIHFKDNFSNIFARTENDRETTAGCHSFLCEAKVAGRLAIGEIEKEVSGDGFECLALTRRPGVAAPRGQRNNQRPRSLFRIPVIIVAFFGCCFFYCRSLWS